MTTFGSVCSGIEAASVAWHPLGWRAAWLSEIEPFPCAVLAHHYPDVPNLGDMTALPEMIRAGLAAAPDVFTGGTPCQAFSVAGKRESLGDARGNLSLTFCEIANAIDHVRSTDGREPSIIVWENVPGVLSTADNAFGCFLGALAGADCELQPAGKRWTDAGVVLGPRRTVAWRILDAQYFGLAQRRRRVFVVASARAGFDPGTVLLEFDGVRRDSAPRREAGQSPAPTLAGCSNGGGANGPGRDVDSVESLVCMSSGQANAEIRTDVGAPALICLHEAPIVAHTLRGEGFDASEDGTGRGTPLVPVVAGTLIAKNGGGGWSNSVDHAAAGYMVPVPIQNATRGKDQNGLGIGGDVMFTLDQGSQHGIAIPFDTTQITSAANYSNPQPGDPCHPLAAGMHQPAIAFHWNAQASQLPGPDTDTDTDTSASLTCSQQAAVAVYDSCEPKGVSHANAKKARPREALRRVREIVGEKAFCLWSLGILAALRPEKVLQLKVHGQELRSPTFSRNWLVHNALSCQEAGSGWLLRSLREASGLGCSPQGWELAEQFSGELGAYLSELSQPGTQAARFMCDLWESGEGSWLLRQALSAVQEVGRSDGVQAQPAQPSMQVRRLTCEEAEFLQGFPRSYTAIPYRKKPADQCPDGPRYKALGNSWAVPCAAWIGARIDAQLRAAQSLEAAA